MDNGSIDPNDVNLSLSDENVIRSSPHPISIPIELTKELHLYELEYITSIIQTYFPLKTYTIFKTQKDILNHFHLCESLCLSFISKIPLPQRKWYKRIIYQTLNELFDHPTNAFRASIRDIISSINPSFKDNAYLELYRLCGTNAIPHFLLKTMRKYKSKTAISIKSKYDQFLHSNYLRDEIKIATKYYTLMNKADRMAFESFDNRKVLFAIAILANHDNLNKNKYALMRLRNKFNDYKLRFLNGKHRDKHMDNGMENGQPNESIDGRLSLMTFEDLYITYIDIPSNEAKELLQVSIDLILRLLSKDIDKLIDILISFFFVFQCKDLDYDAREVAFITNIISSLTYHISTPQFNIKGLFSYIESYDVILNHSSLMENITFDYTAIHEYLSKSPQLNNDYYTALRHLNDSDKLKHTSITNAILNLFIFNYSPFTSIQLTPLSTVTHSNSVTILIGGFLSEDKDILSYVDSIVQAETRFEEFYCFKWPSDSLIKAIAKLIVKSVDQSERSIIKSFLNTREKAKLSGRILGLMLYSKQMFPWQTFNLIGYSLGSHVIKHCIKQINKLNNGFNSGIKGCEDNNEKEDKRTLISNVLFIGGATQFANQFKWSTILSRCVSGRIMNCYSTSDSILTYCYQIASGRRPIGIGPISNDNNLIEDYDLTHMSIGHLDYWKRFKDIIDIVKLY